MTDFYDGVSSFYDEMTRFDKRVEAERTMLQRWQKRYDFSSVVDVACGTGLHAILLAEMGVRTVGVDISSAMIEKAQRNSKRFNVNVTWQVGSMLNLVDYFQNSFDAVFCLGNSVPHLLTESQLTSAIQNFAKILNPNGLLVLQILNYASILQGKNRIVGIHQQKDHTFVRFYDFEKEFIRFNILAIKWQNGKNTHSLHSTQLYPYRKNELENVLTHNGFKKPELFGNMQFAPFDMDTSKNLVIAARKCD